MNGELRVVEDVPTAFADLIVTTHATRHRPNLSLALSGGMTARRCYRALATRTDAEFWSSVELFWGDERCVPPEHPDSNLRLAREELGERFGEVLATHPMECAQGPAGYDALIRDRSPLDIVHLGLGPDGHTASLFPDSIALGVTEQYVVLDTDPHGRHPHRRMTLTYPAIAAASLVIVTVEGPTKADALQRVMTGDPTAPAAAIDAAQLIWLVDRAALGYPAPR